MKKMDEKTVNNLLLLLGNSRRMPADSFTQDLMAKINEEHIGFYNIEKEVYLKFLFVSSVFAAGSLMLFYGFSAVPHCLNTDFIFSDVIAGLL